VRIVAIVKFPPIQGGVSAQSYWVTRELAAAGHDVTVVTNSPAVEPEYRLGLSRDDLAWFGPPRTNVRLRLVDDRGARHVPYNKPYAERLAAAAIAEIRRNGADLVYSYYLQPYGVAGHLAAAETGLPHVFRHAGSDRFRLLDDPTLAPLYKTVLRNATAVMTPADGFLGLGLAPEAMVGTSKGHVPRDVFRPEGERMDLAAYGTWRPELPTVGVYGKVARSKGHFDLVEALAALRREGVRVNLVAMVGGRKAAEFRAAVERAGLADDTILVPFQPAWRVPELVRACDVVCYLERDFPIAGHAPLVPTEVFATGTCLVVSREAARKELRYDEILRTGAAYVVEPKDHAELAAALRDAVSDLAAARERGRRGHAVVAEDGRAEWLAYYERTFAAAVAAGRPARPSGDELRSYARRVLPAVAAAAGDAFEKALDVVATDAREPWRARVEYAAGVLDTVADASPLLDFLAKRARLRLDLDDVTGRTPFGVPVREHDEDAPPCAPDDVPVLSRLAEVVRVDRATLDAAAAAGDPIDAAAFEPWFADGSVALLLQRRPNLLPRVFAVGAVTERLLAGCDGRRTVAELADELGVAVVTVRRTLAHLAVLGVVAFVLDDPLATAFGVAG
jgi:glycosyltransferase involved in cell wall biosynthesis